MIVRVGGVLLTAHAIAAEGQQAPITAKRVVDWKSGEGIIVRFAETAARLVPEFGRLQLDKPPYSEAAGFEMLTDHRATYYVQILTPPRVPAPILGHSGPSVWLRRRGRCDVTTNRCQ